MKRGKIGRFEKSPRCSRRFMVTTGRLSRLRRGTLVYALSLLVAECCRFRVTGGAMCSTVWLVALQFPEQEVILQPQRREDLGRESIRERT
jgi:hypothetical protein